QRRGGPHRRHRRAGRAAATAGGAGGLMRTASSVLAAVLLASGVAAAALGATRGAHPPPNRFAVQRLVADTPSLGARVVDRRLVNPFGLAAGPGGPWWTANEAVGTSTLFAGSGAPQTLPVRVDGGPTGIVYNPTAGFRVGRGR